MVNSVSENHLELVYSKDTSNQLLIISFLEIRGRNNLRSAWAEIYSSITEKSSGFILWFSIVSCLEEKKVKWGTFGQPVFRTKKVPYIGLLWPTPWPFSVHLPDISVAEIGWWDKRIGFALRPVSVSIPSAASGRERANWSG